MTRLKQKLSLKHITNCNRLLDIMRFILLVVSAILGGINSDSNFATLNTKLGNITGRSPSLTVNNIQKKYSVFRRIPFAKAHVGDLRFHEPVPYGHWSGTLDATEFGPSCIQVPFPDKDKYLPNKNQSEDCIHACRCWYWKLKVRYDLDSWKWLCRRPRDVL